MMSDEHKAWVVATSNLLASRAEPHIATTITKNKESSKICIFAATIPETEVEEYMKNMTYMHELLIAANLGPEQ